MTDKTDSREREALVAYLQDCDKKAIVPDVAGAWHAAFQAGRASLAANAGSEPVAQAEGVFEFWWADHMPNATQEEAWREWCYLLRPGAVTITHPSPPEGMVMVPKDALSKCKVALERYSQVPPNYHNSVLRLRDSMRELLLAAWAAAPPTSSADSRKGDRQ